jgi:hypothetical protein
MAKCARMAVDRTVETDSAPSSRSVGGLAEDDGSLTMSVSLPLAGLLVDRTMALRGAALHVSETVTNANTLGRVYNIVQHPTIAPPFLTTETVVDCNGAQLLPQGDQRGPAAWPTVPRPSDGAAVDLRHLGGRWTRAVLSSPTVIDCHT